MRKTIFSLLAIIAIAMGVAAVSDAASAKNTYLHDVYQGNDGGAN